MTILGKKQYDALKAGTDLKIWEQFALELWAKMDGWDNFSDCQWSDAPHYHKKRDNGIDYCQHPKIDHPFLFKIIKGMDAQKQEDYIDALLKILGYSLFETGGYSYEFAAIHTASIPDILQAIYEAMHD